MSRLPSLRRKILRSFSLLVALYAFLGFLLVIAVSIASRNTPRALHRNYDSISALQQMAEAWSAMRAPKDFGRKTNPEWQDQFKKALAFEEKNITEPGEGAMVREIRIIWDRDRGKVDSLSVPESDKMRDLISSVIQVNEKGMFAIAQENTHLSRLVLLGAVIFFLISLVVSLLFGDSLATRLASPLKVIAEILQSKPSLDRRLKLPDPTSLELLILNQQLTDLWERLRRIEQLNYTEILKQRNKLEVILQSVEDAVLLVEGTGEVSQCNACMLDLLGLAKDQVIGHLWRDLPSANPNYLKLRQLLVEETTAGIEVELFQKEGKRNYAIRNRRIERPGWSHSGMLFLLHDITERRQRDRLRSEIIDLLSHELKTPLQSLGTASEILEERKSEIPEDLRLMVETVTEDVQRIRAVANEFVQVTQTHSKIMKLKFEKIPLNQVIEEWLKPFKVVAKDRGVHLELVREGSEVLYANIDLVKFPWVISNLVSNAIRFSPNGGTVQIKVTDRNGAVEIQVADEGPGVPIGDRDRIFEPFYQARVPSTDGARGLFGVGLTIAKEVVEAHDGRIEYYPKKPHGSEFRILLPFPSLDLP